MIIFKTALKRCLKKPLIIITLLIMPIVCLIIDYPFKGSNDVKILNDFTIAVSDNDNSDASKAFVDKIASQYTIQKAGTKEINTLLTNKSFDWAIVIPEGFQENLQANKKDLIESYGFAAQQKWESVKLNIQNIVSSMRLIASTKDSQTLKDSLSKWYKETPNMQVSFLVRSRGLLTPGIGLLLYAMIILYGSFLLTRMFVEDKESELTARIATSTVKPWRYLFENLICFSGILIVQNSLMILAYSLINPHGIVHPFLLFMAFAGFSVMSVGLMLTISTVSRTSFIMLCASTGAIMVLSMLGGLMFPLKMMPQVMKKVAMVTPTYWFSETVSSIFSGDPTYTFQLVMLLGFAVVFFLVGSWKRYSTLD